jgi:UDP-glucose 4-epimerase
LLEQLRAGETGATAYEIASERDSSVMAIAETVQRIAREELDIDPEVRLVENPRSAETLVEEFLVDTSKAREELADSGKAHRNL